MGGKSKPEKSYGVCFDAQTHRDHLCHLMEKGLTAEIKKRTNHPAFVCGNCGAQANGSEDLCNPRPLSK